MVASYSKLLGHKKKEALEVELELELVWVVKPNVYCTCRG